MVKAKDFVRELMVKQNLNPSALSKRTGVSRQAMYAFLKTDNGSKIFFSNLQKILNVMGYKLVAIPVDARMPNGSVTLE